MIVNFSDLLHVYEKVIYKNCKSKRKVYVFEINKLNKITAIYNELNNKTYKLGKYNIFAIRYPKYRIIMSLNIKDKIVNHYLSLYYLFPTLEKYLDNRNVATRSGFGCDYGIKLIRKYIERNKKYKEFYILKLDISKYFYNINHKILKSMLVDKFDSDIFNLLSDIIDSTDCTYVSPRIDEIKKYESKYISRINEISSIPNYEKGKGLPIGNMTSQFFAIFYLYKLDHYIIHDLKIRNYLRYMDDFILIHNDYDYLKSCKKVIEEKLCNEYKLKLNTKKCKIYKISDGFEFLGYKFKVINNKTICNISKKTLKVVRKRIRSTRYKYCFSEFNKTYCIINTYYNCFKYGNNIKLKRYINGLFN